MKILHILYESKGDYFGIGGVGIRAYEICKYLKNRHDITFLCKKYPGAKDGDIEGLRHIFVGAESKNFTKTLLSYAYHASEFVRKHGKEFDVIVEEFSPAIPTFLNFYKEKPVILQIQGYTGKKYFGKYNILYAAALYFFEKFLPAGYKNIIMVSEVTRKRFALGRNADTKVIPNGIPEDLLKSNVEESDYILYLGRIDIHHKGLDLLLSAYAEFKKCLPDIRLVIAGGGRDKKKFDFLADKFPHNVKKDIEMAGWVEGVTKKRLMEKAIFVVMPSRYEVQPIVALEAMACAKALVVSDIPELSYVKDCGAGVSFKSGDAASMAGAMKDMMTRENRSEMGQRGRDWVKDLTWDKIAIRYEEFLSEVAAEGK